MINPELNEYTNVDGSLNSNINPFVIESKKSNQNLKTKLNDDVYDNENNRNKFNGKPPYKFNKIDAKEIDIKYIELNEEDIYDNKTKDKAKLYKKFKVIIL